MKFSNCMLAIVFIEKKLQALCVEIDRCTSPEENNHPFRLHRANEVEKSAKFVALGLHKMIVVFEAAR